MMTRQEIFDRAFIGLTRQNFERANNGGKCLYRRPTGYGTLKCAMGHVLPDDKYNENMEGSSGLLDVMKACGIGPEKGDFCRNLQKCHDKATSGPEEMLDRLLHFAFEHDLKIAMDFDSPWFQSAMKRFQRMAPLIQKESRSYRPTHQGYPDTWMAASELKMMHPDKISFPAMYGGMDHGKE